MTDRISPRQIMIALLIVSLAYALRVILIVERAAVDPLFIPAPGTDMYSYLDFARRFIAGTWPTDPYYYQPMMTYTQVGLIGIIGDSVPLLRLAFAWFDALTAGVMVGAGWLLTRRAWGGYVAGLTWAIYPVAVFYGTTLLAAGLASNLVALFFFFVLWQRKKLNPWRTLLIGLVCGALGALRMNLMPLIGLYILWLLISQRKPRPILAHGMLAAAGLVIAIAPFTLWNAHASGGDFIPVATTGSLEIYIGNNRDADGLRGITLSMQARDIGYREATLRDIAVDPVRWLTLLGRKFAAYWGPDEPGNNIDFQNLRADSRLLQSLALTGLNHYLLSALSLFGLAALWRDDRALATFFGLFIALMIAVITLIVIYSRIRYPVTPALILLTAYLAVRVLDVVRSREIGSFARQMALPAVGIAALLAFPAWALSGNPPPLPIKRAYDALPADANPLNITFDETLTLAGWRPVAQWPASENGWLPVGDAYTVELFWQVQRATDAEYNVSLAYLQGETAYAAADSIIGAVSYPALPTSRWDPGTLYSEIMGLRIEDAPTAIGGRVQVGVYVWGGEGDAFIVNALITAPPDLDSATLQTLAVYPRDPATLADAERIERVFGLNDDTERIALLDLSLPERGPAGATMALDFTWQALTNVHRDYNLFIHVMDADDQLAAQGDTAPVPAVGTSNWRPGHTFEQTIDLQLPTDPGTYTVYIGLIDALTGERLPTDAPDSRPQVGRIVVE